MEGTERVETPTRYAAAPIGNSFVIMAGILRKARAGLLNSSLRSDAWNTKLILA